MKACDEAHVWESIVFMPFVLFTVCFLACCGFPEVTTITNGTGKQVAEVSGGHPNRFTIGLGSDLIDLGMKLNFVKLQCTAKVQRHSRDTV